MFAGADFPENFSSLCLNCREMVDDGQINAVGFCGPFFRCPRFLTLQLLKLPRFLSGLARMTKLAFTGVPTREGTLHDQGMSAIIWRISLHHE